MNVAIVNCFDTYEHRVDLLHDFFCANGDSVWVYTSNFRHIEKIKRTDEKEDFIYIDAMPYYKNISLKRLHSHYKLAMDIFERLTYQKIDLVWVLIPPNSLVKEAAKYKEEHPWVKLIFDVIDMWPETMPVNKIKNTLPIQMWKKLRDGYIMHADYVVTECDLFQDVLRKVFVVNKMTTIYLAREIKGFQSQPSLIENKVSLCYLGSINNIIDISEIQKLIKKIIKTQQVELHIIGDGEKRQEFIEGIERVGAEVIYHGKIYDTDEKQRVFDSCHYGLNIMKDSVFIGLTMKSIDYFEAGLPIINNIKGDTWKLVKILDLGVNIEDGWQVDITMNYIQRENARKFFENYLDIKSFNQKVKDVLRIMEVI